MFYTLLYLTALLSQLQSSAAISTQVRSLNAVGSIAALNNLVVIGDPTMTSNEGTVSFSLYSFSTLNGFVTTTDGDFSLSSAALTGKNGQTSARELAADGVGSKLAGKAFKGLGHAVAIADSSTAFVSQTNIASQTGRVIVYKGNGTDFQQNQILAPYDGKHPLEKSAAFGESIAATSDNLAVGCQNCNTSAPVFSGAVYVYKPTKEGSWSESQVLSVDGMLFLGERVAMHDKVLIAAGDDTNTYARSSLNAYSNIANTVAVFEEKGPKFELRQVLAPKSGGKREFITGITVFDETIAITTMGSDTPVTFTQKEKVYIYYPMNKRYGLEPKGKPSPQQWTNTQILTDTVASVIRHAQGPYTSISQNSLGYFVALPSLAGLPGVVKKIPARRPCLSCQFALLTAIDFDTGTGVLMPTKSMLTSDANAFYSYAETGSLINDPTINGQNCLTVQLSDMYNDGWGIASLVVTSPSGRKDSFSLSCTSANPNTFLYCPPTQEGGKYDFHIDKGKEVPFGWEIIWKVAAAGTWYVGDRDTHMDFIWDTKYSDFGLGATKGLLPVIDTCEVCNPNRPEGKHRSLANLRSLRHRGKTSAPTISEAPTILATGTDGYDWHEFKIAAGGASWFKNNYDGANFYISDPEGHKLISKGTSCTTAVTTCWQDLHDGDYIIRAGRGVDNIITGAGVTSTAFAQWTFCGSSRVQSLDFGFKFSVVDDQCYVGASFDVEYFCKRSAVDLLTYYYLSVDLLLTGASTPLGGSDEEVIGAALSETFLSVVGMTPAEATISKQSTDSTGVSVTVLLGFTSAPDMTALDNLVRDTTSAASLLNYDLIGSHALTAKFLGGEVSDIAINAVNTAVKHDDFSKVDESSFQTVTDHLWLTASVEQQPSNNFNVYAEYVAEGAYAIAGVAAVLAVSFFVKSAVSKTSVAEEDVQA